MGASPFYWDVLGKPSIKGKAPFLLLFQMQIQNLHKSSYTTQWRPGSALQNTSHDICFGVSVETDTEPIAVDLFAQ
jgi:hypothetical protein